MRINEEDRNRNGHVLIWDQPGLNSDDKKSKKMFGTRHFVSFMLFLGMANAYVMRTNMSVAIVAMVNHTYIEQGNSQAIDVECIEYNTNSTTTIPMPTDQDGDFNWTPKTQGYILSSFFYGYVVSQIPFGVLAKRFGALGFLGWGMLINSIFAFVIPVAARSGSVYWLCVVRFIQGLGEGPIVPCTHAMLAKWIPPNERSRMGAAVYAGAQFGTIISMPLSGLLSEYGFDGGWPSIFYVFGLVGLIWSIAFLMLVHEDPSTHPHIDEKEKKYINSALWGTSNITSPPVPYKSIMTSLPFYAILFAHVGSNYGYDTLMTELPTYMKQVLRFSLKENGTLSALPYLAMWIFSMVISLVADWMIYSNRFTHTITRKVSNTVGQFGPAVCLIIASYTGCDRVLTVFFLTLAVGLNGAIYSGFKINHLDITPRFAGILMAFTNCTANLAGLLAPIVAGHLIDGTPTMAQWRKVFFIAAAVYIACGTFYILFSSGDRQAWDNPLNDAPTTDGTTHQLNGTNNVQTTTDNTAVYPQTMLHQPINGQTQLNGSGVRETIQ